jgi:hypothetical protein
MQRFMQQKINVKTNDIGKKRILDIILLTFSRRFSLTDTI